MGQHSVRWVPVLFNMQCSRGSGGLGCLSTSPAVSTPIFMCACSISFCQFHSHARSSCTSLAVKLLSCRAFE